MTLRKETELDCDFGDCEGILTTAIDKGDELVKIHIERLEARDKEHLAKAEEADEANIELEKSNETLYQQKIKLMSELAKIEQAIDDAQKTWYDPDNFVFLKYDETDSDEGVHSGMYGEGWELFSLLEQKDGE